MISQLSNHPSFPRRRAVHWDEDDKAFTPLRCKPARWHNVIGDSSIHRTRGHDTLSTCRIRPPRHCGLDPQSRGADWAAVILASRQYPQGGVTTRQPKPPIPLSLDGRGIKGEGDSKTVPPCVIPSKTRNPQGGCVVAVILALRQYPQGGVTTRQHPPYTPLPDGRGSKPVPVPDTGIRG